MGKQLCRLDGDPTGKGLYFELVLIDGNEDSEYPFTYYCADSSEQIALATALGFPGYDPAKDENEEGEHGQAYDWLAKREGQVFDVPEGHFEERHEPFGVYVNDVLSRLIRDEGWKDPYPQLAPRFDPNGNILSTIHECHRNGCSPGETTTRVNRLRQSEN